MNLAAAEPPPFAVRTTTPIADPRNPPGWFARATGLLQRQTAA